jgi:hypothetical protein
MQKVIVSTVLLGLAFSASSVFAENEITAPTAYAVPVSAPVTTSAQIMQSADVVVPSTPEVTSVLPVVEKTEVIKTTSLEKIKARGLQLIKERINALTSNANAIANSKALTAEQKTAFATYFSGKVAELNATGIKISSSTDATTTKTLISSIFTDFRIYAVVVPQSRLQKRIYELQNHSVKLAETFAKVQTNIDAFKAKGKDVTVWQKNLDDAKLLVASDTQKLPILLAQINALKPADYGTSSKTTIESVNKGVRSIASDFQGVARKVRRPEILKSLKKVSVSAATSVQ